MSIEDKATGAQDLGDYSFDVFPMWWVFHIHETRSDSQDAFENNVDLL